MILTTAQIQELEAFIQELPVKFGVPLLNLMRKFDQENKKPSEPQAVIKPEDPSAA